MASEGYPGTYKTGLPIAGIKDAEDSAATTVFHAGTSIKDENVVTAGGRVLGITSRGENVTDAIRKAYNGVEKINWKGAFYRKDIAAKVVDI